MQRILRALKRRYCKLHHDLDLRVSNRRVPSLFVVAPHKSASSLFSGLILKYAIGLRYTDHPGLLHNGGQQGENIEFKSEGVAYGPIRLTANRSSAEYLRFVKKAIESPAFKSGSVIFFIRDIRDIMVSAYYSYGFTHSFSSDLESRRRQEAVRAQVECMTLDEFVIEWAPRFKMEFREMREIHKARNQAELLKYEEMIMDWESFQRRLLKHVSLHPFILQELHSSTRPLSEEKLAQRRSGQVAGYKTKLKPETVNWLNDYLSDEIAYFGYSAS